MSGETVQDTMLVADALARLAIARGGTVDRYTADVYLDDLADVHPELVARACQALRKEPRAEYEPLLPTVATIRARCEQLARADADAENARKLLPMPASEADPRTLYFCLDCHDESSGWREMFCHGAGEQKQPDARPYRLQVPSYYCGRKHGHVAHYYVERCACYERNPVIAKRREAQARRKSEAA